MYGKLLNRLKKSCNSFKITARSFRTRSTTDSPTTSTKTIAAKNEKLNEETQSSLQNKSGSFDLVETKSLDDNLESIRSHESNLSILLSECDDNSEEANIDQFWAGFINSDPYKNWLKVGIALRSACAYLSPILDEIVHNLHKMLLEKHGYGEITQEQVEKYKHNTHDSDALRGWMRDILKLHRQPPTPGEVFRISYVTKWPTSDGAWEIARVFMSKGYRTGGEGESVSAFDISALLNFMYRCRLADEYILDFSNVKKVIEVRNTTMHNPSLQVDDESLAESFDTIFALLKDSRLRDQADKHFSTREFFKSLNEVKTANFDLLTSAKHSLNILKDDIFDPVNKATNPSTSTIVIMKEVLSKILALPHVNVTADFSKIQTTLKEMETKVVKEYEQADEKIKKMSAHVDHMNQKLDHLRDVITKSKRKEDESSEEEVPRKKLKRKRRPSQDRRNTSDNKEPFPTGILDSGSRQNQEWLKIKEQDLLQLKPILKDQDSLSIDTIKDDLSSISSTESSFAECENNPSLAQYGSYSQMRGMSIDELIRNKRNLASSSDEDDCDEIFKPTRKRKRYMDEIKVGDSFSWQAKCATKEESNESFNPTKVSPNMDSFIPPSKGRPTCSRTGLKDVEKLCSSSSGTDDTDENDHKTYLTRKLQHFLLKQPENPGPSFKIRTDIRGKFYCSLCFTSKFAVSAPCLAGSEEEAKNLAALEAYRRVNKPLNDVDTKLAKQWFDRYAIQETDKSPCYSCFRVTSEQYASVVQLINNKLVLLSDTLEPQAIFIQTSYDSYNPTVDVERQAIKSALQEFRISVIHKKPADYRSLLNEFCLANEATIPIVEVRESHSPKTGKKVRTCSLISFKKKFLNQIVEGGPQHKVQNLSSESEAYNAHPVSADYLESNASDVCVTQQSAEENAAANLLKTMGLSDLRLFQIKESCKNELKELADGLDLSIVYHTTKLSANELAVMYGCVVTSFCLDNTTDEFAFTSGSVGCDSEQEACEAAARNAVLMLGMETVLGSPNYNT